jgi:hypothetical protein
MSINSRLIMLMFLSIVAAGTACWARSLLRYGYFLICHIYHDLGGEPYETTGETGRQSDRGGDRGYSRASRAQHVLLDVRTCAFLDLFEECEASGRGHMAYAYI